MLSDQAACWTTLRPALAAAGRRVSRARDYSDAIRRYLASYFSTEIYPLLTPLAFDPGHPFPLISNRSKNFAVVVRAQPADEVRARQGAGRRCRDSSPIPPSATRRRITFAFLEDVIRDNLGAPVSRRRRDRRASVPGDSRHRRGARRRRAPKICSRSVDRTLKELRHGAPSLLAGRSGDAAAGARTCWSRTSRSTTTSSCARADRLELRRLDGAAPAAAAAAQGPAVHRRGRCGRGASRHASSTTSANRTARPPPVRFVRRGRDVPRSRPSTRSARRRRSR